VDIVSDDSLEGKFDETPTVEVRVYRDGRLVHRELCESDEHAALVVEEWSEVEGTGFEVDDLSSPHRPDQILDLEPSETGDDDAYPTEWVVEADRAGRRH
jgi:hypothetical protein